MNLEGLDTIFKRLTAEIEGSEGGWRFVISNIVFFCISDALHNRMRIISPITKRSEMSAEQLEQCLKANFHSSLDARYALSDNILYAAFIHPLAELTEELVINAIDQIYSCVATYGTTYSSGFLKFPTREDRDAKNN